ncbi:MAG: hypothetical protein ACLFR2_09430 [Candidatus Kapaibacterium sp.]
MKTLLTIIALLFFMSAESMAVKKTREKDSLELLKFYYATGGPDWGKYSVIDDFIEGPVWSWGWDCGFFY